MTTKILREAPALFRAYSRSTKEFVPFGILTTRNEFFIKNPEGTSVQLKDIDIDLFLGGHAEDGTPIYENDIVEVATMNEFGSATLDTAVVRFDPAGLAYFLESKTKEFEDILLPTKIVRVIGHDHD